MNARILDRTRDFVKQMKELEHHVLTMATSHGLGEPSDLTARASLITAWRHAVTELGALETGANEIFAHARRLFGVDSLEEAERSVTAELEAQVKHHEATANGGARLNVIRMSEVK